MTTPSPPPFAPLPVRARTTLEIFDTAFKLFRRYAGVLLGWAFLSSLVNLIPLGGFAYVFTLPLFYGAVSCVIAAAVRGQNVKFGQVWGFTKARYGAMVGVLILAGLLFLALIFGVSMGVALLSVALISLVAQMGTAAYVLAWIVGILAGTVVTSLFLAVTVGWFTLAPIVACLEDGNRGPSALSRALSLLSGSWRKACAISVVTSLAQLAAAAILGSALAFLFYGGFDKFVGANASDSASLGLMATSGGFSTLFLTFSMPVQTLIIGVFYLDLRTRKEALDLEWTNYAAQPEPSPEELVAHARPMPPTPPQMPMPPTAPLGSLSMLNPGAAPPFLPGTVQTASGPPPTFSASAPAFPSPVSAAIGFAPAPSSSAPVVESSGPPVEASGQSANSADFIGQSSDEAGQSSGAFVRSSGQVGQSSGFVVEPSGVAVEASGAAVEASAPAIGAAEPATGSFQPMTGSSQPVADSLESATGSTESMAGSPASVPLLPPQVLVVEEAPAPAPDAGFGRPSPTPPPIPPKPPAVPAPSETSSFAPPRRAEPDEDPDFPSSFGGGGRR